MTEGFAMELCGNKASWQIVPEGIKSIDLEQVAIKITAAGFEAEVQSRMVWTFTGSADLTLYPSGKLLVKTENKEAAEEIARLHCSEWTR
ncbi:MAG: hypothetical protein ACPHUK_00700 [Candidatus Poseidoniaceae archaeon]